LIDDVTQEGRVAVTVVEPALETFALLALTDVDVGAAADGTTILVRSDEIVAVDVGAAFAY
jgi:hypothetical protein